MILYGTTKNDLIDLRVQRGSFPVCMAFCVRTHFQDRGKFTHIAVPLAGPGKMQLPKGISGIFRGVLGAVPVIDNSCAEVVTKRHRAVSISVASTLAAAAITAMRARIRRLSLIAPTQRTELQSSVLNSTWRSPLRRSCKLFSWWFWGSSSTNIIKIWVRNVQCLTQAHTGDALQWEMLTLAAGTMW